MNNGWGFFDSKDGKFYYFGKNADFEESKAKLFAFFLKEFGPDIVSEDHFEDGTYLWCKLKDMSI